MNGIQLTNTPKYIYLGLTLTPDLTLEEHTQKSIGLVTSKIYTLTYLQQYVGTATSLQIYKSTILPLMEYANFTYTDHSIGEGIARPGLGPIIHAHPWYHNNLMILGTTKRTRKVALPNKLTINNNPIELTDKYKYHSVTLNSQLTFFEHMNSCVGVAASKINNLTFLHKYSNHQILLTIYKTSILQKLE